MSSIKIIIIITTSEVLNGGTNISYLLNYFEKKKFIA